jgi:glucose/arabinose dehydrogenase
VNGACSRGLGLGCSLLLLLCACSAPPALPDLAGVGPDPTLPDPTHALIPTAEIARAVGWQLAGTPSPAPGLAVSAFARGLDHPRWLYVLPNGDVLVAETNAPQRPGDARGLKGRIMAWVMKRAGAGVPSADRITLLRDTTGSGEADLRSVLIDGLHSPFGMALVGDQLYVANTDAVVKFPYVTGETHIAARGVEVLALPAGPINHHWTKNLLASTDGATLYVTVGSNSNVGESGMQAEDGRAAIWSLDLASGEHHELATGLRNPNGMAWEPEGGRLWTVVNERDELGNDLVPDYLTSVRPGAFYGWPWSYYGQHVDIRPSPPRPDRVAAAVAPDYALGSHVAALGLASSEGTALPPAFAHGMFIGEHGSWNRRPRSGYSVVFVAFQRGMPTGTPVQVLGGFISPQGTAWGRPVGVALDRRGALLVADDVGNVVWRVTASEGSDARKP